MPDDPRPSIGVQLGGRELMDEAEAVLRDAGEPLHYREIAERLDTIGVRPRGVDPDATLLTALTRSPAIRGVGRRSGRYYLVGYAESIYDATVLRTALRLACWELANYTFRGKDVSLGEEAELHFEEFLRRGSTDAA